jgi:hypothetical protein
MDLTAVDSFSIRIRLAVKDVLLVELDTFEQQLGYVWTNHGIDGI